jgi:hypothetical protein
MKCPRLLAIAVKMLGRRPSLFSRRKEVEAIDAGAIDALISLEAAGILSQTDESDQTSA